MSNLGLAPEVYNIGVRQIPAAGIVAANIAEQVPIVINLKNINEVNKNNLNQIKKPRNSQIKPIKDSLAKI